MLQHDAHSITAGQTFPESARADQDLVSIIIVNWNGRRLLHDCLAAIYGQSYRKFEIIFVDNGSTDGSSEYVAAGFPGVRLVRLSENRGFTGGNIAGYAASSGDFICLLNNDVVLDSDWLTKVVEKMFVDNTIGICGGTLLHSGRGDIDSDGEFFTTAFTVARPGEGKPLSGLETPRQVPGLCAAAVVYRRTMIEKIGFLDEDFFLNHEDTDFNLRALFAGWKCIVVPGAIAHHRVSASLGVLSDTSIYYSVRNGLWVLIKNVPFFLLMRYLPQRIFYECAALLAFAVIHRRPVLYLRAKFASLRGLPLMIRKRRHVQQQVTVDAGDVRRMLLPLTPHLFRMAGTASGLGDKGRNAAQ